jgi:hypothetical protein
VKLRYPWPRCRVFSMIPLMASVPPLLTPPVSKYARTWARHARSVRPRRATSGIGQVANEAGDCRQPWPAVTNYGGDTGVAGWLSSPNDRLL